MRDIAADRIAKTQMQGLNLLLAHDPAEAHAHHTFQVGQGVGVIAEAPGPVQFNGDKARHGGGRQRWTVELPGGGRQHYAAGLFYMVKEQTAREWIEAGEAEGDWTEVEVAVDAQDDHHGHGGAVSGEDRQPELSGYYVFVLATTGPLDLGLDRQTNRPEIAQNYRTMRSR